MYSVAAPTSGERFYYAIRVAGYQLPVSQGTVMAGTPTWRFVSYAGKGFEINVSVSGERLIFAETTIPTDSGSPTTILIPTLNAPDTGSSGTGGISSGPSAAELAAQALVNNGVLAGNAEVTGAVVRLTRSVLLNAGDTLSIPANVTLETADKKLILETGATLRHH